jgi:hypothetical protein
MTKRRLRENGEWENSTPAAMIGVAPKMSIFTVS